MVGGRRVYAIDGKSVRCARKKGAARSLLVMAFDHATGMVDLAEATRHHARDLNRPINTLLQS